MNTTAQEPIVTDAELVARLQAGDESAFEKLVRTYMPRLLRVARRFLSSEEDARDAVPDAMPRTGNRHASPSQGPRA